MNDYLFKYEDAAMRTLYVAPLNHGVAFLIEEGLRMHSVCLSTEAVALLIKSLTPAVGAEGGAGCPVVVQAEPGPVVGGSPARASLDGRKARLAEALDPDGEGLFTDDPRGQT